MKKIVVFSGLFFFCCLISNAQKLKGNWYLSIMPTAGNAITSYKNNISDNYKDSLNKLDRWRPSIGASLLFGFEMRNKDFFQIGLQYHNFGFTRKRENYRFLDTLPGIGIMFDKSQTGGNYINFNYRYQYLSIPFLYSKHLKAKQFKSSSFHWTIGGSLSGLINHDIRAVLHGFSAYGKKVFIIDNEVDNPSFFNINFQTGFRLENLLDNKRTYIFVQPTLYIPAFSANYSKERHHLYSLALEVGIVIKPEKAKAAL
ncbi:MAG: outer membrane beta-barrel protein [Bacteroidota bacterium]